MRGRKSPQAHVARYRIPQEAWDGCHRTDRSTRGGKGGGQGGISLHHRKRRSLPAAVLGRLPAPALQSKRDLWEWVALWVTGGASPVRRLWGLLCLAHRPMMRTSHSKGTEMRCSVRINRGSIPIYCRSIHARRDRRPPHMAGEERPCSRLSGKDRHDSGDHGCVLVMPESGHAGHVTSAGFVYNKWDTTYNLFYRRKRMKESI